MISLIQTHHQIHVYLDESGRVLPMYIYYNKNVNVNVNVLYMCYKKLQINK